MIGLRGMVLFLILVSAVLGFVLGGKVERAKWTKWNYAHVAWDGKGDRK